MKKIHFMQIGLALMIIVTMTSSIPAVAPVKADIVTKENIEKAYGELQKYTTDKKLSFGELKNVATTLKGSSLSFKERLALRLFGKKISGKAVEEFSAASSGEGKSQVIALILCLLVGGLGIHRFYLGYTWQGIVQLLTLGLCGIWTLIDLIRIITGDLKPKDGEYATKL
jgi:TM2 domain-containing membrane protein YozV